MAGTTMTNHVVRLYTAAAALVLFFVAWAGIAARPWVGPPADPRLIALANREQRLQRDARLVQQVVDRRWADYRAALARSRATTAPAAPPPAPSVRVVTMPPVATTRSS
jgi:hypothetical protein